MRFKVSHYGWLPDLPDHRDFLFAAPVELAGAPSAKVDLRAQCPPVYAYLTDENLASDFWTIRIVQ